jgi:proteasome lid subunit RPN8/RPN11
MSSEINFGDLNESEPQSALRPDQDGHFVIAEVGEVSADELLIFVDLDVMRDMEAHAHSNTRVELGGVMLGQQNIDEAGRPFVVITDSLRARHYEATKGSFKFTHDTWTQITRERSEFRPDLEMVGWYHTHPGWSVFLSGMDLFICNNFFNRPLDVALVIDPCNDDRGWFHWTAAEPPKTSRTGGFYLITGRYRQQELNHFARIYNREPTMNQDPRYAGDTYSGGTQPVVNLMDNRRPIFDVAIVTMLLTQFLLFAFIGWKLLVPATADGSGDAGEQVASLQQKLTEMEATQLQQARDQAYQEVLQSIVGAQTGDSNLVKEFTTVKSENQQLQSNLKAQMALADSLNQQRDAIARDFQDQTDMAENLSSQLVETRDKLGAAESKISQLSSSLDGDSSGAEATSQISLAWWWLVLGGVATVLMGGALGFSLARYQSSQYDDFDDQTGMNTFRAPPREATTSEAEPESPSDVTVKIVDGAFGNDAGDISSQKTIRK